MTKDAATEHPQDRHVWWRWSRLLAGGVVIVGGLLATVSAVNAWGLRHGHGAGGGEGHQACAADSHGGPMGRGMGWMTPGGRGLDRLLDDVDATQEQRQRIDKIASAARADLDTLRGQGQALREQQRALMASGEIDAAQAEKLRAAMVAHHDAVSRRMLASMLDMQKVLTPPQRARLAERLAERSQRGHERRQERRERRHPDGQANPASGASRS